MHKDKKMVYSSIIAIVFMFGMFSIGAIAVESGDVIWGDAVGQGTVSLNLKQSEDSMYEVIDEGLEDLSEFKKKSWADIKKQGF